MARATATARSRSAACTRACTPVRYAVIRPATRPASRGRSSGSTARQSFARETSSASAPQLVQPRHGVGRVAPHRLAEDFHGAAPGIGRLAGEDLAEDRAQTEDVGTAVDSLDFAGGLLRRHVRRRAQHAARLRVVHVRTAPHRRDHAQLGRGLGVWLIGNTPFLQDLRQPPVHHLHLAERADHHVRRLQVAVDDAPGVGVGHRLADGLEDGEKAGEVVRGRLALRQQRRQRPPLHQLHREIGPAVGERAQLVDRHDAGMLELAADLRFLHEPPHQLGLLLVALEQDLDRQVAAEVRVAALEHRPHPAPRDLAEKLVAVATLRRRWHLVGRWLDHGHTGIVGRRVGKQDPGNRADRPGQALQDMAGMARLEAKGHVLARRAARRLFGSRLQPGAEQAGRAEALGNIRGQSVSTPGAASFSGHGWHSGEAEFESSTL